MHYKKTPKQILMISAIALTFFSIQEAWTSKKLDENGEDDNRLKRKLPDNLNEGLMALDSDFAFALQMQMNEDPFFDMSPMKKKPHIMKEKDDSTYDDERDTHESENEIDAIDEKLRRSPVQVNNPINLIVHNNFTLLNPDQKEANFPMTGNINFQQVNQINNPQNHTNNNNNNYNNNNNNLHNEIKKKTVLKIGNPKYNKQTDHNDNVMKEQKEEHNVPQIAQPAMPNFHSMENQVMLNQFQPLNSPLYFNQLPPPYAPQFQANPYHNDNVMKEQKEEHNVPQIAQPIMPNFHSMENQVMLNQFQPMNGQLYFNQPQPPYAPHFQANPYQQPAIFGISIPFQGQNPVSNAPQLPRQPLPAGMQMNPTDFENPQEFLKLLQDAQIWHIKGKPYLQLTNKNTYPQFSFKFDPKEILPTKDKDLIDTLIAIIDTTSGANFAAEKRKNRFLRGLYTVLYNQDKLEMPEDLRQQISITISNFDKPKQYMKLIKYIEAKFNINKQPKSLNSPVLKGLSGDRLPEFIEQIQIQQRQIQRQQMQMQQQLQQEQKLQNQLPLVQPNLQNAPPKLTHDEKGWTYNRANAKDATPEEAQLYVEIRTKLIELSNKIGHDAAQCALINIEDVETLHKNNIEICDELFKSHLCYSKKFNGVVLHGENGDSNLEMRAQYIYLIFLTAWNALNTANNEELYVDFFKNAFVSADRFACLEGRTRGIDNWYQRNKSKLNNINLSFEDQIKEKTFEENIGARSTIIYKQVSEQSVEGKKLNNLRKVSDKHQAVREKLRNDLNMESDPVKKGQMEQRLAEIQISIEAFQSYNNQIAPTFETPENYQVIFERICQELEGKEAKDGTMTREMIKDYLVNILCYDLD